MGFLSWSLQESSYVLFIYSACLRGLIVRGLARHFKTEPTVTVALCFGYPKTP
jgi:hypothetical protein